MVEELQVQADCPNKAGSGGLKRSEERENGVVGVCQYCVCEDQKGSRESTNDGKHRVNRDFPG